MTATLTNPNLTLDTWLEVMTEPVASRSRQWHHRWSGAGKKVRSCDHLVVLMSSLRPGGDFAGITDAESGRWTQVKRQDSLWWVEGRAEHEDWPGIFVPAGMPAGPGLHGVHAYWPHHVAAELAWAWLDGRVVAGAVRIGAPSH